MKTAFVKIHTLPCHVRNGCEKNTITLPLSSVCENARTLLCYESSVQKNTRTDIAFTYLV